MGILDGQRGGRLLDHIPAGSVLEPIPPGGGRMSRARCDRCGCWISQRSAVLGSDGWISCGVCHEARRAAPS
jgi:formylmethanofuran dehydrogenase subunit E